MIGLGNLYPDHSLLSEGDRCRFMYLSHSLKSRLRIQEIIVTFFTCLPILAIGQIENRWQPDSVYANRKVKQMRVYLNSQKDLSEIVDFDRSGKRVRSIKYSASYNRRSRERKAIQEIKLYNYDSLNQLISIIDSVGTNSTQFQYNSDSKLISSRKQLGKLVYHTKYFHNPFKSTTTVLKDSRVIYEKTKEYERGFYVKRNYGYYYEAKLKKDTSIVNGSQNITAYSDHNDMQRFEDDKSLINTYDSDDRLIRSEIRSIFMNDRVSEYELNYTYYKNGLLKSISGYVPRFFKYDFWE